MSPGSRPGRPGPHNPRRPASRTPTARPRRLAGQSGPGVAGEATEETADTEVDDRSGADAPADAPATGSTPDAPEGLDGDATRPHEPQEPDGTSRPDTPAASLEGTVDRAEPVVLSRGAEGSRPRLSRLTVALAVAIVILLGVGGWETWYLLHDDSPTLSEPTPQRPVQLSKLEVRSVVDQAASAADTILSASAKNYDAQVQKATGLMTAPFAEQYRTTKSDIEQQFLKAETKVTIDISAQGVVSATPDRVVALLFLTQSTTKGNQGVTVAQYRVSVTMENTDQGWLVSNLKAQ